MAKISFSIASLLSLAITSLAWGEDLPYTRKIPCHPSFQKVLAQIYGPKGPFATFLANQNAINKEFDLKDSWEFLSGPSLGDESCHFHTQIGFSAGKPFITARLQLSLPVVKVHNARYDKNNPPPPSWYCGYHHVGVVPHLTLWYNMEGSFLGILYDFSRPESLETQSGVCTTDPQNPSRRERLFASPPASQTLMSLVQRAFDNAFKSYFEKSDDMSTRIFLETADDIIQSIKDGKASLLYESPPPKPVDVKATSGALTLLLMLHEGQNPFLNPVAFSEILPQYKPPLGTLSGRKLLGKSYATTVVASMEPYIYCAVGLPETTIDQTTKLLRALWEALYDVEAISKVTGLSPFSIITVLRNENFYLRY